MNALHMRTQTILYPEGPCPASKTRIQEYLQERDFNEIYRNMAPGLNYYIRNFCRNADEAEELVQETFLKFLAQLRKGRVRREGMKAYLKTMVRNEFISSYRRKRREETAYENLEEVRERREKISSASREIKEFLNEELDSPKLSRDIAEILRLRYVENLGMKEICRQARQSRATVFRMSEKGARYLHKAFQRGGICPGELPG